MSSSTLVTFFLSVPSCYSVQLFGSWDNFSNPYHMKEDTQKGRGNWVGCHAFDTTITDGFPSQKSRKKNKGLEMGGTYYYFYRLDCGVEYYNPSIPTTSTCPLLPGQPVNILEVPIELSTSSDDFPSGGTHARHTLNPKDRYKSLRPPTLRRQFNSPMPPSATNEKTSTCSHKKLHESISTPSLQALPRLKRSSTTDMQKSTKSTGKPRISSRLTLRKAPTLKRQAPQANLQSRPQTRKGEVSIEPGYAQAPFPNENGYVESSFKESFDGQNEVASFDPEYLLIHSPSPRHHSIPPPHDIAQNPLCIAPSDTTPTARHHKRNSTFATPPLVSASHSPDPTPAWLATPSQKHPQLHPGTRNQCQGNETLSRPLHTHAIHDFSHSAQFHATRRGEDRGGNGSLNDDPFGSVKDVDMEDGMVCVSQNPFVKFEDGGREHGCGHGGEVGLGISGLGRMGMGDRMEFLKDVGYLGAVIV